MERRQFLKLGLFGSSLLVLGGSGLALWPGRRSYAPRRPLRVISDAHFPVLAAAAARAVSAPSADPIEIAHGVDDALALSNPEAAADFDKLLGLLESPLAGLLLDGRPT